MFSRLHWITTACAVLGFAVTAANAQFLPLLTFEGPDLSGAADGGEGLGVNNGGVIGTFGATEGTSSLVFTNRASGDVTFFDIGTVNGDPIPPNDPERLNNYSVIAAASQAAASGEEVFLEFDVTYDATGVTTEGFIQLGVFINSEAGFDELRYGNLSGGNIGGSGDFPTLNGTAAAGGVTMTVLEPSNFGAGDFLGAVRFSIPVGPAEILMLSDGGDTGFDFAQLGLHMNSGYAGGAHFGFDRIGFQVGPVPEPASVTLLGLGGLAMLRRR